MEYQNSPVKKSNLFKIIITISGLLIAIVAYFVISAMSAPEQREARMLEEGVYSNLDANNLEINANFDETSDKEVPADWPSVLPIPPGVIISQVINVSMAGYKTQTVSYTTNDNIEEITALYVNSLTADGWSVQKQNVSGIGFSDEVSNKDSIKITATNSEDVLNVTAFIENRKDFNEVTLNVSTD